MKEQVADPYKSSSFIGHSLWMVPTGDSLTQMQALVNEIGNKVGTRSFLPHITLVAALMGPIDEILATTKLLASQLEPYSFYWRRDNETSGDDEMPIGFKDAYFQCVFAQLQLSKDVMEANALARRCFPERSSDPPYMPHLSLVYGDLTEVDKTSKVIPYIQTKLQEASKGSDSLRVLPVNAIEVWSTQGDVSEWYLVQRIPLGQGIIG